MFNKKFFKESKRVLTITKKPSREEHYSIMKISGLGILLIGLIGFLVSVFAPLLN